MINLNKKISGDWFDIKESFTNYYDLYDFFKKSHMNLNPHIEKLKFAVEQGITEYKRIVISPFFRTMDNVRFHSPTIEEINNQIMFLTGLLFTVLTQRLIAAGDIRISGHKNNNHNNGNSALESMDLKEIFININERIKNNPRLYKYILIPFGINIGVFSLLGYFGLHFFQDTVLHLIPQGDAWYWFLLYYFLWTIALIVTTVR